MPPEPLGGMDTPAGVDDDWAVGEGDGEAADEADGVAVGVWTGCVPDDDAGGAAELPPVVPPPSLDAGGITSILATIPVQLPPVASWTVRIGSNVPAP